MNNNAFKDMVQKQGRGPSTKEIARRAVEEEQSRKQKKRRRRGGGGAVGGYLSSSDEDGDDEQKKPPTAKKMKALSTGGDDDDGDDDVKDHKLQKELASRYRDRAKERREGKDNVTVPESERKDDPNEFLIVPHNKKGLDLALVRRERRGRPEGGTAQSSSGAAKITAPLSDAETLALIELPDMDEAKQALREFVASNSGKNISDACQNLAVTEYIRETLDWTIDWNAATHLDAITCGTAGKTLQHTNYSMSIDGHPSDTVRAWELPRQAIRSGVGAGVAGNSDPIFVTDDLLSQVDRVFKARRRLLDAMKHSTGGATLAVLGGKHEVEAGRNISSARRSNDINVNTDDPGNMAANDDDDDDIFGGDIGEYIPLVAPSTTNDSISHNNGGMRDEHDNVDRGLGNCVPSPQARK